MSLLDDGTGDLYSKTFVLEEEDHTLANALRYIIMKNPDVVFCGYTQPHPSEARINFKIQTNMKATALDVLEKGLQSLNDVCIHVLDTFAKEADKFVNISGEAATYSQMEF
jgi:DNA-directed RNA polymerase I and III subunit RPAC2